MRLLAAAAFIIIGFLPFTTAPVDAAVLTFDWTLSGPAASLGGIPFPASGTITVDTTMQMNGGDEVTGITGTIDGSIISGLSTFDGADNLLFPSGTAPLDTHGIAFTTVAGQSVDIFSFFAEGTPPTGNAYGESTSSPGGFGVGTFALTATPLPATLPLFAGGLGLVGFLTKRRKGAQQSLAAA